MKWRDVLIGSIATLIVTILSGVVIYYLTREPRIEAKENMVFLVDNSASFDFANTKMAVASIILVNRGTKAANNVAGEIKFPFGHIKDKKITSPSGANTEIKTIADSSDKYSFAIPRFLPNDEVSMSFLLDTATAEPTVTIRSDTSIASKVTYTEATVGPEKPSIYKTLGLTSVPLVLGLIISLVLVLFAKRKVFKQPREACFNNTAFVLMHKGMVEQADSLLKRAVDEGKDGSYAIANYALSRGLLGHEKESSTLLDAATFLANTKHERAVIQFNRSLLSMKRARWDDAKEQLSEALRLSSAEIRHYCKNSNILLDLVKDRADMMEMTGLKKQNALLSAAADRQ
jgi:tetratricopeptide (TPR) repeat protein